MKITVTGCGYVGLVTGACLAELGNEVLCLDLDSNKVDLLNRGGCPIHEPGLVELIERNRAGGRIEFTTDAPEAVSHGFVQIIAVGTPPDEDGSADLSYVLTVAQNIGRLMTGEKIVVNKSTVPVGTATLVHATIRQALASRVEFRESCGEPSFHVVSNPEFLKEGAAVADFQRPDRIVVGVDSQRAEQVMRQLYAPFQRNHNKLMVMDIRSAELTKYAANAMLATRISFMNELANLSEALGADIERVRMGIGSDSRIGFDFLYAGCGYGGSCFPKDVKALIKTASAHHQDLRIIRAVEEVNVHQRTRLLEKILAAFGGGIRNRRFAIWGLSFKPNTDDIREAPSCYLIEAILNGGATVCAYDPVAMHEARLVFGARVDFAAKGNDALIGADALIIMTEWKEFQSPNFERLAETLKSKRIFDGRNLFDPATCSQYGLIYEGIGRGVPSPAMQ